MMDSEKAGCNGMSTVDIWMCPASSRMVQGEWVFETSAEGLDVICA